MKKKIIGILLSLIVLGGVSYVGIQIPEQQEEITEDIEEIIPEVRYLTDEDFSLLYSYKPEKKHNDLIELTQSEAVLLMKVARAESGTELVPQMWAMRTILNRMESNNPDFKDVTTVGQVINQARQFQVVTKGTFEKVELNENSHIALAMIESGWNESEGSLYFKASSDKTEWFDQNLTFIKEVGGQMYYK